MELKLPTNQRDQLLLVAAIAAFALVGVYYWYMWSPKRAELVALEARIDTLTQQNETIRLEVARGTAGQLREQAEEYGRTLSLMRQLVPTANEVPGLIDQISTAGRQVGLDLGAITPRGVINGDVFDTYKYQFTVSGPYHRVAEFLTNIASLRRIVAPMNLSVGPSSRPARTGMSPQEMLLDATFEIQTFVARTPPPAVSAAPRAGG